MDFLAFSDFLPLAGIDSLNAAFADSDGIGKFIVVLQLLISIFCGGVAGYKTYQFKRRNGGIMGFRRFFTKMDRMLGYFFQRKASDNPLINIYTDASSTLVEELSKGGVKVLNVDAAEGLLLGKISFEKVKNSAEESLSVQESRLDAGMTWIATGASLAPLLGLLGTVWGVLDSFQAMGKSGSVNLAEVAPGLSSAMLTTLVGLVVAIILLAWYNFLCDAKKRILLSYDNFVDEYLSRVKAEFSNDRP